MSRTAKPKTEKDLERIKASRVARDKKWRDANKDHVKSYFASYYEKHKAAISARRKARYDEDPEYKKACVTRSKARNARVRAEKNKGGKS